MKLLKILFITTSSFCFSSALAFDMESFYQEPENEQKFQLSQQSGLVDKVRMSTLAICQDSKKKSPEKGANTSCDCFAAELEKLSDREIFYETVSAYQHFQKMVAAKTAGNQKEYARLKEEKDSKKGFAKKIEEVCRINN